LDEEGVLVVDVGERAQQTRGRRHRHMPHRARRIGSVPERADRSLAVYVRHQG
jgi:hypothetical protein